MQDKATELEKLKKQLQEEQKKRGKKAAGSTVKTSTRTQGRKTAGQGLGISKEPAHKCARNASAAIKAVSGLGEEEEEVEVTEKVPSVEYVLLFSPFSLVFLLRLHLFLAGKGLLSSRMSFSPLSKITTPDELPLDLKKAATQRARVRHLKLSRTTA